MTQASGGSENLNSRSSSGYCGNSARSRATGKEFTNNLICASDGTSRPRVARLRYLPSLKSPSIGLTDSAARIFGRVRAARLVGVARRAGTLTASQERRAPLFELDANSRTDYEFRPSGSCCIGAMQKNGYDVGQAPIVRG